jgi:hypothetical protein
MSSTTAAWTLRPRCALSAAKNPLTPMFAPCATALVAAAVATRRVDVAAMAHRNGVAATSSVVVMAAAKIKRAVRVVNIVRIIWAFNLVENKDRGVQPIS